MSVSSCTQTPLFSATRVAATLAIVTGLAFAAISGFVLNHNIIMYAASGVLAVNGLIALALTCCKKEETKISSPSPAPSSSTSDSIPEVDTFDLDVTEARPVLDNIYVAQADKVTQKMIDGLKIKTLVLLNGPEGQAARNLSFTADTTLRVSTMNPQEVTSALEAAQTPLLVVHQELFRAASNVRGLVQKKLDMDEFGAANYLHKKVPEYSG